MSTIREKEQQAISRILDVVLASNMMRKERTKADKNADICFYGHHQRDTDYEMDKLTEFFEQDIEDLLQFDEIWLYVADRIKDDLDGVWLHKDRLLKRLDNDTHVQSEVKVSDIIETLAEDCSKEYQTRMDKEWAGRTVNQIKSRLEKGCVYVGLLDISGLLTQEPFPLTMNTKTEVTWTIELKEEQRPFHRVKTRELYLKFSLPVQTSDGTTYNSRGIKVRDNEVAAVIIKT